MAERKVVLITGATGGIGRATSIAFAKTGQYDLALHYHTASPDVRERLRAAVEAAAPSPIRLEFFPADLSNFDAVRRLHEDVTDAFNQVDVLFNNAGAAGGHVGVRHLRDVPIEAFAATWRLNTGAAILLAQLCLPDMEHRAWGRVVFTSSAAAFTGGFVGPHYASSKSALHGFVHWLGENVARSGVTVNAVAPAMITDTGMIGRPESEAEERRIAQRLPVNRLGTPEEIAATVLWMVNTPFLTRKIIAVDGGLHPC